MRDKSWTQGFLYAVTPTQIYGSYNPLAPYNPVTRTSFPASDYGRFYVQWHLIARLGKDQCVCNSARARSHAERVHNFSATPPLLRYYAWPPYLKQTSPGIWDPEPAYTPDANVADDDMVTQQRPTGTGPVLAVNGFRGLAIAPRTCVFDGAKYRDLEEKDEPSA